MKCHKATEIPRTIADIINGFPSKWDCFKAIAKYADLFEDDNEEFARVEKEIAYDDKIYIYWDDGVELYTKEDVNDWTPSDFSSYLNLYDREAFAAVAENVF
jgi:hypothetical protein